MFANLKSYIKDENYLISFMNNCVHCYNYVKVENINEKEIKIQFKNKKLTLKGNDFILRKLDKKELLVSGEVVEIELR